MPSEDEQHRKSRLHPAMHRWGPSGGRPENGIQILDYIVKPGMMARSGVKLFQLCAGGPRQSWD